jgi:hypothetical protein
MRDSRFEMEMETETEVASAAGKVVADRRAEIRPFLSAQRQTGGAKARGRPRESQMNVKRFETGTPCTIVPCWPAPAPKAWLTQLHMKSRQE